MYPRNAASPPRIAIGAVVQISDGAVQTSGCTVRILEQGGAEGDGAGTTAYSTDGVVIYTPTQAETDQIGFILIAKKTGCIPVSQTIITSASDVTGYAGVDWSKVNAPTTAQALTGTTIATTQKVDVETIKTQTITCAAGVTVLASVGTAATSTAQTGDAFARLGAPAGASVSADVAAIKTDTGNLVTRITSTLFSGITSLAQWLGMIAGKQTGDTTARTEIRATGAGSGTFDETTDSVQAIRDRGDAAWITATGFSTLDAAGVRTAVGLGAANLDTQLAAIKSDTAAILVDTGTDGVLLATGAVSAAAVASDGANEIADALLDRADAIETGITVRLAHRYQAAAAAGVLSGAATTTAVVKGANVATTRITATVDADGNRSAVTLS